MRISAQRGRHHQTASGEAMSFADKFNLLNEFNILRIICALFLIPHIIAKFTVPETPGKTFIAKVISTSQAITAGSGSMLIQLSADNPSGTLLPGGFATVSFDLPGTAAGLSVPPSALIFTKAGLRVATVSAENKVVLKTVVIGRDYGNKVELSSGLDATDRVIESPPDGVTDGDVVKVAVAEPKKP